MLELSGQKAGKLSAVVRLVTRAQAQGEPVAWVGLREQASFYPLDFAEAGVDLAAAEPSWDAPPLESEFADLGLTEQQREAAVNALTRPLS